MSAIYFLTVDTISLEIGKTVPVTGRGGPQGCETSRLPHILDNRLTVGSKAVSLLRRPPFTPRTNLVLISVTGWVDSRATVRLKGLGRLENPLASSRIEPATFRLVAQCLNQLRYRVPQPVNLQWYSINHLYLLHVIFSPKITKNLICILIILIRPIYVRMCLCVYVYIYIHRYKHVDQKYFIVCNVKWYSLFYDTTIMVTWLYYVEHYL
jgi:hypothetical protein